MTGRLRHLRDEWRLSASRSAPPSSRSPSCSVSTPWDELDRSAFAVLLPDIRDHFGLSDAAALALVAATTIAVLVVEIPPRSPPIGTAECAWRRRCAAWALFSRAPGSPPASQCSPRCAPGPVSARPSSRPPTRRCSPTITGPEKRNKVFPAHRLASSTGQIIAPLLAGSLAMWLGWRAPFLLFAIPSVVLVLLRPGYGSRCAVWSSVRPAPTTLRPSSSSPPCRLEPQCAEAEGIRTIRRIWFAAPFLAIALFGIPTLLSLVYEDVFGLNAGRRGLIATVIEPLQIVGVGIAMPAMSRLADRGAGSLVRFVAVVGVVDGVLVAALAYAPDVSAGRGRTLCSPPASAPGARLLALVSLVAPPHVRAATFSTIFCRALPGIAVFLPVLGAVSDAIGFRRAC